MTTTTDTKHAVFARTADGERVRVADPSSWDSAQREWRRLDDLRHAGRFPHVRHFEVRSIDDPTYSEAPSSLKHSEPTDRARRGYANAQHAARAAWKLWQGTETRDGKTQGTGGWFYYRNGRTAAQGLWGLEKLARSRGLITQGVDDRWYPHVTEL